MSRTNLKLKHPDLILYIAIALAAIGFKLASQPGQLLQNDGYAISGGLLILAGGTAFGWWLSEKDKLGTFDLKRPRSKKNK